MSESEKYDVLEKIGEYFHSSNVHATTANPYQAMVHSELLGKYAGRKMARSCAEKKSIMCECLKKKGNSYTRSLRSCLPFDIQISLDTTIENT